VRFTRQDWEREHGEAVAEPTGEERERAAILGLDLGEDVGIAHGITKTYKAKGALLVQLGGERVWVPLSQLHEDSEVKTGFDHGVLIVSRWFARKMGWGRYREISA
jgi:hypothetical protein